MIRCSCANASMVSAKSPPFKQCISAPSFTRQRQVLVQARPVGGLQAGLLHVSRQQRAVESLGVALPAFQHCAGVASRRQTDQNALLRSPVYRDAVRIQILLQLPVHHVGGQQQRQLAQFGEHARVAHRDIGRRVHHFDFVGFAQELLGDAGEGALSGNALRPPPAARGCTAR